MAHYESWWSSRQPGKSSHALERELRNLKDFLNRDKKLEAHTKEGLKQFQAFLHRIFHPPGNVLQRHILTEELSLANPIYQGSG